MYIFVDNLFIYIFIYIYGMIIDSNHCNNDNSSNNDNKSPRYVFLIKTTIAENR